MTLSSKHNPNKQNTWTRLYSVLHSLLRRFKRRTKRNTSMPLMMTALIASAAMADYLRAHNPKRRRQQNRTT